MKTIQKVILLFVLVLFGVYVAVDNSAAPRTGDIDASELAIQYDFFDLPNPLSNFSGKTYYVAPNGDDNAAGTEAKPWRSIQKAADTLKGGERVLIKQGVYKENVIIKKSGTKNTYIIFQACPGADVIIDGTGVSLSYWTGLLAMEDVSYIAVSGLKVKNSKQNAILVENCKFIYIHNNYTHNSYSSGIGIWNSKNVVVDGNEVVLACNDGDQECISVAGCDGFIIRNNHVHHGGPGTNGGEGIDAKHGANGLVYGNQVHDINRLGIYVDAWDTHTYNISVYNNSVHDCKTNGMAVAAEAGGLLENIKIFNNIIYKNNQVGITVAGWGEDVPRHPLKDIYLVNNTIYKNGRGSWGGGISVENSDINNIVIMNNIISKNYVFQIQVEVPIQEVFIHTNLIHGYRGYSDEKLGHNCIKGDPGFMDSEAADFHLKQGSLALDKAQIKAAPPFDFDFQDRNTAVACDLGAVER